MKDLIYVTSGHTFAIRRLWA